MSKHSDVNFNVEEESNTQDKQILQLKTIKDELKKLCGSNSWAYPLFSFISDKFKVSKTQTVTFQLVSQYSEEGLSGKDERHKTADIGKTLNFRRALSPRLTTNEFSNENYMEKFMDKDLKRNKSLNMR